jgi:hypothetical protein
MIRKNKFKFRRTVDSYIDLLADAFTQNLKIDSNNALYKKVRKELTLSIKQVLLNKYRSLNPIRTIKFKKKI